MRRLALGLVVWFGCGVSEPSQPVEEPAEPAAAETSQAVSRPEPGIQPRFNQCLGNAACLVPAQCDGIASTVSCGPGGAVCCNPAPSGCQGICYDQRSFCTGIGFLDASARCPGNRFCCIPDA